MSKKGSKENPIVKSQKVKGIKSNGTSEEGNEIKKFIIIIIVLVILVSGIYGISLLIGNKEEEYIFTPTKGQINYDVVSVGTILNRPLNDYYVMVFDSTSTDAVKYNGIISLYNKNNSTKKDYIKIYYCDLDNLLNKKYYNVNEDNKSNPKAKKVTDFDFGDLTLLHIKKGKITEYIEDYKTIQEKLK